MPKISVIVPVYNTEKYLHRCIDSILAQTFTDFELLLIDDGSKDNSGKICDEYAAKDSRVRVFHKENRGVSSARNMGLDNAKGEWVTFADSDDYTKSCWLENFEYSVRKSTFDLICQGYETVESSNSGLNVKYGINFVGPVIDAIDNMFKNNILGFCWNKLFSLNIIKYNNIRFNESLRFKEDELFLLQYVKCCKTCFCIDKVGYYYHVPNWDSKYIINSVQQELTVKNLFIIAHDIFQDKSISIYKKYIHDLTDYYFYNILNGKTEERYYNIKELRKILNIDFINCPLCTLTKCIIYLDPTFYLSSMLISIHVKIKYLKKIVNRVL